MKMKLFFVAVLLVVAPVTAMGQVPAEVQAIIDEANAYLPTPAGGGMDLTSIGYDRASMVYTMEFDDDAKGLTIGMMDEKVLKAQMLGWIKGNSTEAVDALMNVLETYDLGMTYVFRGRKSGKSVTVLLTVDEVRAALKSAPDASQKDELTQAIDMMNTMFPQKVNENVSILRVEVVVDTVFYVYEINEQFTSLDNLEAAVSLDAIKAQIKTNAASVSFTSKCKQYGKALGFRYVGRQSGRHFDMVIPVDEL